MTTATLAVVEATAPVPAVARERYRNPAEKLIERCQSEATRRSYVSELEQLARLLGADDWRLVPWHELADTFDGLLTMRLATVSAATASKTRSVLRGLLRESWRLGYLSADERDRFGDIQKPRGSKRIAGRAISQEDIDRLLAACQRDTRISGLRDALVLGLGFNCGLRRAEICDLELGDFDPTTGDLTVRGKGNKERVSRVAGGLRRALDEWLRLRGDEPGPLLHPVDKWDNLKRRRLAGSTVMVICERRADQAGVARFSPHDMRRSFVTNILEAGVELGHAQDLAGHSSPDTTRKYDRRPEQARLRKLELLPFTWRAEGVSPVENLPTR